MSLQASHGSGLSVRNRSRRGERRLSLGRSRLRILLRAARISSLSTAVLYLMWKRGECKLCICMTREEVRGGETVASLSSVFAIDYSKAWNKMRRKDVLRFDGQRFNIIPFCLLIKLHVGRGGVLCSRTFQHPHREYLRSLSSGNEDDPLLPYTSGPI